MSTDDILIDDWYDLYGERWGKNMVGDAYQHPAKFSRGLIRRIYRHMHDEGWVQEGDIVLDPFAGVALGALDAMYWGLHWIGIELENGETNAYVDWGRANIKFWNQAFGEEFGSGWGTAVLVQGDSRFLIKVLQEMDGSVSSPPYGAGCQHQGGDDQHPEHIEGGTLHGVGLRGSVASPPYGDSDISAQGAGGDQSWNDAYREYLRTGDPTKFQEEMSSKSAQAGYGRQERGQLANMPYEDVEALLSSPGYSGTRIGSDSRQEQIGNREAYGDTDGQMGRMKEGDLDAAIASPSYVNRLSKTKSGFDWSKQADRISIHPHGYDGGDYGETEGQMGRMPEGDLDATIASPPFQQQTGGTNITAKSGPLADPALHKRHAAGNAAKHAYGETDGQLQTMNEGDLDATVASPPYEGIEVLNFTGKKPASEQSYSSKYIAQDVGYGETEGQLSVQAGDTFWSAAFQIVQQVYQVLRPGGHAVWVVKAYVKDWEIVDFPGQWQRLCEAAGFKTVHIHRAWQVDDRGTQLDMFGGAQTTLVEHKSYFRRNMEQKGSPRIDYEIVLCMEKPGDDV